jgi:hypothetical protein
MCVRVTCQTCGKPSWSGCGLHVEQVLAGVAVNDRCACPRKPAPAIPRWVVLGFIAAVLYVFARAMFA